MPEFWSPSIGRHPSAASNPPRLPRLGGGAPCPCDRPQRRTAVSTTQGASPHQVTMRTNDAPFACARPARLAFIAILAAIACIPSHRRGMKFVPRACRPGCALPGGCSPRAYLCSGSFDAVFSTLSRRMRALVVARRIVLSASISAKSAAPSAAMVNIISTVVDLADAGTSTTIKA